MCPSMKLNVPDVGICLEDGCRVKLGRFETTQWVVHYGWYAWGGNREVCGWYLEKVGSSDDIKPLQKNDLYDIYLIEY